MSKIMFALGCIVVSTLCFADNNIVYLDQSQLLQKSVALSAAQKKLTASYDAKLASLQKEQNGLNSKLNNATNNSVDAAKLSADLLQLQQQMDDLNATREAKIKEILAQYFAVERVVLKKMLEDQHYSYILNMNAVYMTESANDVTPTVLKLTDSAYEQKYTH